MAVLIKRYANRKLYNTQTSRYITLKGIAELLEDDEEVQVIAEDQTLSQVILDQSRRGEHVPPSELLHELIRRGGSLGSGGVVVVKVANRLDYQDQKVPGVNLH